MNHTNRIKRNTTTIKQKGGKSGHVLKKATIEMDLTELEDKARLFYKLAVVKDRKLRFRMYRSTFVGKELVDSMVVSGLAESRKHAVDLGRAINENFDLFENCEKKSNHKTTGFDDDPSRVYRFTSGALTLIRRITEREMNEDENSVPTSTSSVSTATKHDRPNRGPGLQRQNGTRSIKSCTNKIKNYELDICVFDQNKRFDRNKNTTSRSNRTPICATIEEDNKCRLSYVPSEVSITNTTNTELGSIKGALQRIKEQSKPESEEVLRAFSKEKNVEFDKIEGMRHRLFSQHQSGENPTEGAIYRLEKTLSAKWSDNYESFMKKMDAKGFNVFPDDCRDSQTLAREKNIVNVNKKGEDRHTSLIDEFDTETTGDHTPRREDFPGTNKGSKSTRRSVAPKLATNIIPPTEQIPHSNMEPAGQIDSKSIQEEESEYLEPLVFITSPEDFQAWIRRRMSDSDNSESFDNFEFILNKKEGNLLTKDGGDDQSTWTEYIIGDEEGRKQYRQNEMRRRSQSFVSCTVLPIVKPIIDDVEFTVVNTETVYEDNIYDEEGLVSRLNWEPSNAPTSASKQVVDDQSFMDFTVLDNTIAVSYVEDDDKYIEPEAPPPPEDDEKSLFHIFANRAPISEGGDSDDDDMTQITMDHALMREPEKNHPKFLIHSSLSTGGETEQSHSTTKNRIQTILWNDLSSCDFTVVRLAMEELRRIVASEPESRNQIVRMGGVMAIMGTMEKYFEQEVAQYYCCVIIELLASMEPDAMKAFNEMKGIQMIVRSMQDQADSDRVQEAGRAALATLCRMHHHPGAFY